MHTCKITKKWFGKIGTGAERKERGWTCDGGQGKFQQYP